MRDFYGRHTQDKKDVQYTLPINFDKDTALILSLIMLLKNEKNTKELIMALIYILM